MNEALSAMLLKYKCSSATDYQNAFKETIQHIALLGLWRTKFFEHAAFYGGTALRIFYGLDRFSEDIDFSLLKPNKAFDITPYLNGIKSEIEGFGISISVDERDKSGESPIKSAFIKTGTRKNILLLTPPEKIVKMIHPESLMKIRFEIDVDPPPGFETETKYLLEPIPFSVTLYKPADLFAGKVHAVLCRRWKTRVKGRDWYDFVWYIRKGTPVNLSHLEERMKQTDDLPKGSRLTEDVLKKRLINRIDEVDFNVAKKDVIPLLKDPASVEVWSREFFKEVISQMIFK
jgi:predicted nucleotidyltransferase component of viral defense system